ncbi:MAG: ribonuclease P protein component [Gammaproteobacteria bacterium]|nr:MAG: ribonuclease P protein component [Gammaproteobacteria bacterium]
MPRPHGDEEGPPGAQAASRQGPAAARCFAVPLTIAATSAQYGFRAAQKLRSAALFERVRKLGRRDGDALFGLQYAANDLGGARLGMAVGTRVAGSSVERNRLRRLIRESFRLHRLELPAMDFCVTARAGARDAASREVFASLERLWGRVRRSP